MSQIEAVIVSQYTTIVGALDQIFQEIDVRSNGSIWRWEDSPYAGVGSCKYISKSPSESGLVGPARQSLIELREQKAKDFPGLSPNSSCPYHRENQGRILGELKSPLCISHIDGYEPNYYRYDELQERFGIRSDQLAMDISWILRTILEAKDPYNRNDLQSPIENDTFVNNAYKAVLQMTDHVKRFPILHSNSTQAATSKE